MDLEEEVAPVYAKKRFKPINRRTKIQVVFDEKARREFLTGFRKRKQERKKRAQEELKEQLKEEKKRIKLESKEQYKKMTKTFQPIPELEEKLAQLHQVKNSTVSILELDPDLLAENNFIIGRNRINYDGEDSNVEATEEIKTEINTEDSKAKNEISEEDLKTKKELKRALKKQATKMVKKSAAFKKLNKQEQLRQRKKSKRKKEIKLKKLEKSNKKKNRFTSS